ncbi:uncharacterized protein BDR25DRAFT_14467 [Lindgomyces ingoldianus]|uniref:Uncharacterized protein n=1 Tax=Lindgomyces ingoldianus TaxID=673940 RepID=A0ACB6R0U8_9PLEO|nr:uncharacterized protein BDR25DRAFT_14467 [Lindgomyces ingoldianus]KAF2472448.1 hypothetical protein BDR25DRAFT_14467 [Lindgomyces ingoldianus]
MAGFGFSISDILALSDIAWNVYKSSKHAGEDFKSITTDVNSLQTALHELNDEVGNSNSLAHRSSPTQQRELTLLTQSCKSDLQDLEMVLTSFKSLKTTDPRFRDRLAFTAHKQAEIRGKLVRHSQKLNLFLTQLHNNSLARIELASEKTTFALGEIKAKLNSIHQDVLAGRRDPNLLANIGDLEKELVDDNITEVDIEENRDEIAEWVSALQDAGYSKASVLSDPAQQPGLVSNAVIPIDHADDSSSQKIPTCQTESISTAQSPLTETEAPSRDRSSPSRMQIHVTGATSIRPHQGIGDNEKGNMRECVRSPFIETSRSDSRSQQPPQKTPNPNPTDEDRFDEDDKCHYKNHFDTSEHTFSLRNINKQDLDNTVTPRNPATARRNHDMSPEQRKATGSYYYEIRPAKTSRDLNLSPVTASTPLPPPIQLDEFIMGLKCGPPPPPPPPPPLPPPSLVNIKQRSAPSRPIEFFDLLVPRPSDQSRLYKSQAKESISFPKPRKSRRKPQVLGIREIWGNSRSTRPRPSSETSIPFAFPPPPYFPLPPPLPQPLPLPTDWTPSTPSPPKLSYESELYTVALQPWELENATMEEPIPFTLEELFSGATKKIKITKLFYEQTTGNLAAEEKVISTTVWPGAQDGSKLPVQNLGIGLPAIKFIVQGASAGLLT